MTPEEYDKYIEEVYSIPEDSWDTDYYSVLEELQELQK